MVSGPRDRRFFGHPTGLGYLLFAEAWERFSYYGMQALLVLYMGQQLLLPGHVEHVAGFQAFRAGIEAIYGHLSVVALASVIFGLYAGLVYLTPLAGGLVADRWLGRTPTIVIGAVLMAAGHFLMAFEVSFLGALALLLIGVGCFKGNITSQVGELYAPDDPRRADAFQIYQLGVNIAVIVAPLVCGALGQRVAWHWGFGAAGVGMLVGLAVYLSGRRWLPGPKAPGAPRPRLVRGEGKSILILVAMLPVMAIVIVGNQQISNAYLVWGAAHFDMNVLGQTAPVSWLISLDAFISAAAMVGAVAFWRWWARRRRAPNEMAKMIVGGVILAVAPLILAAASALVGTSGHKIGLGWALGFHVVNDIGSANMFPVGLALYSRVAPKAIAGQMIGIFFVHKFIANMVIGWMGGLVDKLDGARFWLLHAGVSFAGVVILVVFALAFGRTLAPTVDPEASFATPGQNASRAD